MATVTKVAPADTANVIRITPPRMGRVAFTIQGNAPLMTARFSKKAEIMAGFAAGDQPGKRKAKPPRDFQKDMEGAAYRSADGWYGINAAAFRNASISACRLVNFKMTLAKLSVFVEADGFDREEHTPLVRIIADEPEMSIMPVRNSTGVMDLRSRPLWAPGWQAVVRMRWDKDQFSLTDITNLMNRVGEQVGVCEGRPDSRESAGLGYGLFDVVSLAEY